MKAEDSDDYYKGIYDYINKLPDNVDKNILDLTCIDREETIKVFEEFMKDVYDDVPHRERFYRITLQGSKKLFEPESYTFNELLNEPLNEYDKLLDESLEE